MPKPKSKSTYSQVTALRVRTSDREGKMHESVDAGRRRTASRSCRPREQVRLYSKSVESGADREGIFFDRGCGQSPLPHTDRGSAVSSTERERCASAVA